MILSSSGCKSIMAILSGNSIFSTANQLQNHVFMIPWARKKMNLGSTIIRCSKGRDYSSSSGPMRYIPKRSSENNSEVSSSQLNEVKLHDSVESNGKRVELSWSEQSLLKGRSFVVDTKFQKQHKSPINKINDNEECNMKRVSQSNEERIHPCRSLETSSPGSTFDVKNECEIEFGKPLSNARSNVGSGTGSFVPPNVQRPQPTIVKASARKWSYFGNTDIINQSEKQMNNMNNSIRQGTSRDVQSHVQRIGSSRGAQTSYRSGNIVIEPQFQSLNERSIAEYEKELGTSNSDISEGVRPLYCHKSFVAGTEYENPKKKPVEKVKHDVRFGKTGVLPSNMQQVEHSNSEETLACGRSFVLNTEGLGVGEEFDGDLRFEIEEIEDLPEENSEYIRGHSGVKVKEDVQKLAVELLAARALTALELRKKLQGKNCPLHVVDAVIRDFKSRGLINDGLYAETFSRSRWSSSTWGPRRIKQALHSKGVSDEDAEKAVKSVFNDDVSANVEENSSGLGISKLSMDHLYAQVSKQWMRSSDVCIEKRKSRVIRWLQYRGFNWSIISFIMKKLESKSPA